MAKNEVYGDFGLPRSQRIKARDWILAALAAVLVLATGAQLTTQWLAQKLAYQDALGAPWIRGERSHYYAPWQGVSWLDHLPRDDAGSLLAKRARNWFSLAQVAALIAGAVVIMRRLSAARNRAGEVHGSARWAERDDIERAGLFDTKGVVVGKWEDLRARRVRYLRHDGPEHILLMAPTGSGKGVGLVLPTLLSWPESVLVLDPKGENYAKTAGFRAQQGHRVLKLDFAASPSDTAAFNPLSAIRIGSVQETADVQRIARLIVDPDGRQFEGPNKHWAETASSLLTGAILHVLYRERAKGRTATLAHVVDELSDRSRDHHQVLLDWLSFQHDPRFLQGWQDNGTLTATHPIVAASAREQLNREEKERAAVLSSALAPLTLFRDPLLSANTSRSDFAIEDLMDAEKPMALYFVLRPSDIHRLRPIVRIIMDLALRRLVETMEFVGDSVVTTHRHRLLLMLDEFPVLGKLDIFSESLAYIRGWGIKAYLITQDYEQLRAAYGDRETISSNCHIKLAFAPNKPETARFLSELAGTATVIRQARPGGMLFGANAKRPQEAQNELKRPLLTPDEVMRLPGSVKKSAQIVSAGDMLVFAAGSAPIRAKQPLYFQDPALLARARTPPPRPGTVTSEGPPQPAAMVSPADTVALAALVASPPLQVLEATGQVSQRAAQIDATASVSEELPDQHLLDLAAQLADIGCEDDGNTEDDDYFDSPPESEP